MRTVALNMMLIIVVVMMMIWKTLLMDEVFEEVKHKTYGYIEE